jgi:hypothetical protein
MNYLHNPSLLNPNIVSNGLIFGLDPANRNSYSGSGSAIYNLIDNSQSTLTGTYSYINDGIRLNNPSTTDPMANLSFINCPNLSNIVTVSAWYYLHTAAAIWRYFLDARAGGSGGWFASGGGVSVSHGPDWTGSGFVNGGEYSLIDNSVFSNTGVWTNLTIQATSSITDDLNLFSRFSNNEGLDITMGPVLIYNRTLSSAENKQNYDSIKIRYGL